MSPRPMAANRTHGAFVLVSGGVFGQQMGVVIHVAIRAARIARAELSTEHPHYFVNRSLDEHGRSLLAVAVV